jgi:hypothetical protein
LRPFITILFYFAIGAEVHAGTARINCPTVSVQFGESFAGEITIDSEANVLGAYTLNVMYDANVVTIDSIEGGATPEFSNAPFTNPPDFSSGMSNVSGINSSSLTMPTGVVSVAFVTFETIGEPGSSSMLSLDVVAVVDEDGESIATDSEGCTVMLATPTATPTPSPTDTTTPDVTPTPTPPICPGDCNGDLAVSVEELVLGIQIALGSTELPDCQSFDANHDQSVSVDELVTAVTHALVGCF